MHSFTQIKRAADEHGATLVLINLSAEMLKAFRAQGFANGDVILSSDLDRALEILRADRHRRPLGRRRRPDALRGWLAQALGSAELAGQLAILCRRLEVGQGEIIATQGEPARSMHFILEGRIGIIVKTDDGRMVRVRSLGPQTTIGEMGLITRQTRSATVQAELPSVLYALSADDYERLTRENSALAQALLTYTVRSRWPRG